MEILKKREPVRRDPIGNIMSNPIENPIGNRIGNPIGNPICNPIGNPISHPIMLLAPFGVQLGRVRIQDLPKTYPKGTQKQSKNLPGTPTKFNENTPQIGRPGDPTWMPKGRLKS